MTESLRLKRQNEVQIILEAVSVVHQDYARQVQDSEHLTSEQRAQAACLVQAVWPVAAS